MPIVQVRKLRFWEGCGQESRGWGAVSNPFLSLRSLLHFSQTKILQEPHPHFRPRVRLQKTKKKILSAEPQQLQLLSPSLSAPRIVTAASASLASFWGISAHPEVCLLRQGEQIFAISSSHSQSPVGFLWLAGTFPLRDEENPVLQPAEGKQHLPPRSSSPGMLHPLQWPGWSSHRQKGRLFQKLSIHLNRWGGWGRWGRSREGGNGGSGGGRWRASDHWS